MGEEEDDEDQEEHRDEEGAGVLKVSTETGLCRWFMGGC